MAKKFLVNYEETLLRTFIVEADSEQEANEKMWKAADDGIIGLDNSDYLGGSGNVSPFGVLEEGEENYFDLLDYFDSLDDYLS